MDEHGFIRSVHKKLPQAVHAWKINARFANGVPDTWYSGGGGDLWVEYKYLKKTPVRRFTPGLSALQRKWLRDRLEEGRRVAVIVGTPAGACVLTDGGWEGSVAVTEWLSKQEVVEWICRHVLSD